MNEIAKVKKEVKLAQWTEMVKSRNESGLTVTDWCKQKHRMFGKSSEHTECEGQQSFFNETEIESAEKAEEPVKKTVKGYTRKNPKTKSAIVKKCAVGEYPKSEIDRYQAA